MREHRLPGEDTRRPFKDWTGKYNFSDGDPRGVGLFHVKTKIDGKYYWTTPGGVPFMQVLPESEQEQRDSLKTREEQFRAIAEDSSLGIDETPDTNEEAEALVTMTMEDYELYYGEK